MIGARVRHITPSSDFQGPAQSPTGLSFPGGKIILILPHVPSIDFASATPRVLPRPRLDEVEAAMRNTYIQT